MENALCLKYPVMGKIPYIRTKKHLFTFTFLLFEAILLLTIFFLFLKIKNVLGHSVKGAYITAIDKDTIVFDPANSGLKYFYEPKPYTVETWHPDWLGYEVKNTINGDSLNEVENYELEKPDDVYRIITLGDSITYGLYVNTSENYSKILEKMLNARLKCQDYNGFEVINLGVYGYDIEYSVARLKKRGVKYDPNLVIWMITNGNFTKIDEYLLQHLKSPEAEGVPDFDPVTKIHPFLKYVNSSFQQTFGSNADVKYQQQVLQKFPGVYKNNLLILSYPSTAGNFKEILQQFSNLYANYHYYSNLTDIPNYEKYHLADTHPNKEGHKKIAEDIFEYLHKNILSSCNMQDK